MTVRLTYEDLAAYREPRFAASGGLGVLLHAPVATWRAWMRRRHDRRDLLRLDEHMLRDIGLDRSRIDEIAARPFWRA